MIPGLEDLSNTKQVIPLYPNSGLTFANTKKISASQAFDIHIFVPFSLNSSLPTGSARVFKENASEPDSASDKQNDPSFSVAKDVKYFSFCLSLPYLLTILVIRVFFLQNDYKYIINSINSIILHEYHI